MRWKPDGRQAGVMTSQGTRVSCTATILPCDLYDRGYRTIYRTIMRASSKSFLFRNPVPVKDILPLGDKTDIRGRQTICRRITGGFFSPFSLCLSKKKGTKKQLTALIENCSKGRQTAREQGRNRIITKKSLISSICPRPSRHSNPSNHRSADPRPRTPQECRWRAPC